MSDYEINYDSVELSEPLAAWLKAQAGDQVVLTRLLNEFYGGLDGDMSFPDATLKADLTRMYFAKLLEGLEVR